jgi:hypothetical protein
MKKQILLSAAAVLVLASSAYATPVLYVSDGNVFNTVTAVGGVASFSGAIQTWVVNVDTGQDVGNPSRPNVDLNFTDTFQGTAHNTLTIAFLTDGYSTALFSAITSIGGTMGGIGNNGWTLSYNTYAQSGSSAATTFATAAINLTGWSSLTSQSFTSSPFSGTAHGGALPPVGGNPYELLQVITITAPNSSSRQVASGDATLTVPDGGSTLMLLGSGLTALGLVRRSFKRKA